MMARIVVTAILLLIGIANFSSGVLLPPGPLNPFGILFLALSGAFWLGWETIEDSYAYQEERRRQGRRIPDPLLVRFAPSFSGVIASHATTGIARARKGTGK